MNDATGRRYNPRQLNSFRTFFRQTGSAWAARYQDYCDAQAVDESKRHPPTAIVDRDSKNSSLHSSPCRLLGLQDLCCKEECFFAYTSI